MYGLAANLLIIILGKLWTLLLKPAVAHERTCVAALIYTMLQSSNLPGVAVQYQQMQTRIMVCIT